jgi:Cu+-exporting ATPase
MTEQKFTLPITGMTCANCAANIERGVKKLKGVTDANVNFAAESAAVSIDPRQLQLQDVVDKIHASGLSVTSDKL